METDTDFSSDEEPLVKSQPQTAKRTRNIGSFKIRDALKPPRTTSYTTKALYDQIKAGQIELNPEYQRDVVWNQVKMSNIIDSMYRNFYIPPIIFSVTVNPDGTDTKVCIDGKQRLSSIKAFMDGEIPNKDLTNDKRYWFKDSQHRRASEELLDERYTSIFQNKQVVCVEYTDLNEANERDIFRRVQEGSALTTAEKMKGNQGPWARLSRSLIKTYITDENSKLLAEFGIIWDRARARDFINIGSILYVLQKYPTLTNVPSGPTVSKFLEEGFGKAGKIPPPSAEIINAVNQALEIFFIIAGDKAYNWSITTTYKYRPEGANSDDDDDEDFKYRTPSQKKTRAIKAKVAPIEFVMINVLIAKHKSTFTLKQLANSINYMRKQVRQEHVDIRSNGRISKFCLDIINNLNKGMFPDKSAGAMPAEKKLESLSGKKRKRNERGDGDGDNDVESEEGGEQGTEGNGKATKQTKLSPAKDVKGKGRADDVQPLAGEQPTSRTDSNRARSSSSATLVAPSSTSAPAPIYLTPAPAPAVPNAPAAMTQIKSQPQSQPQSSTLSAPTMPYQGQQFQQQHQQQHQQQQQQMQMQRPVQQMQQGPPPMNYSQSQQPVQARQQQHPPQAMATQRAPAEPQSQAQPAMSQSHGSSTYHQAHVPNPNQSSVPPPYSPNNQPQSYPQAPYKPPYHSQHTNQSNVQPYYRPSYPPPSRASNSYPQAPYAPVTSSNAIQPQSDRLAAVRAAKAENSGGYNVNNGISQNGNWQGNTQSRDPRLTSGNLRDPRLNINSSRPSTPVTPTVPNSREAQFGAPTLLQSHNPQSQPHTPQMQNLPHPVAGLTDQNRVYQGTNFNGGQNSTNGSGVAFTDSTPWISQGTQVQQPQSQVQNQNLTSPSLLQRMGFNIDSVERNIKTEPN